LIKSQVWWLTPIIVATREVEIKGTAPRQKVHETYLNKIAGCGGTLLSSQLLQEE
jgi:hypothetical protein